MRSRVLFSAMLMLFATAGVAVAQPVPILPPPSVMGIGAEQQVQSTIAGTKAEAKTTRATREQIQALRLALKAKLAGLHH